MSDGDYGAFVSNFMGDGAGNMYYFVNGVAPWVGVSETVLQDRDVVRFHALRDTIGWSDAYAWFEYDGAEAGNIAVTAGESFDLTLMRSGYDEDWNVVPMFADGAKIVTVMFDTQTGLSYFDRELAVTDENGVATVTFDSYGVYILSAIESEPGVQSPLVSPWLVVTVTSGGGTSPVAAMMEKTAGYQVSKTSNPEFGSEWTVLGLARGGFITEAYKNTYLENLRALNELGFEAEYKTGGSYVKNIKGPHGWIGEFTNGSNSGWMYMVNGEHPGIGLSDKTVRNGDVIVWHYTDDYTMEEDSGSSGGGGGGSGGGSSKPENSTDTTDETETVDSGGGSQWTNPFTDVSTSDWHYDAVRYVREKGLMGGTSSSEFSPNSPVTRAMLVTVLYRYADEPTVAQQNPFTDIAPGQWYTDAVIWANINGIVSGYGDGLFGADDSLTREQFAVVLYAGDGVCFKHTRNTPPDAIRRGFRVT